MKSSENGFTLVELLIVIAIIGILAAVILRSLNDARLTGIDAKIQSEMDSIAKRAEIEFTNGTERSYDTVCGTGGETQSTVVAGLVTSIESFAGTGTLVCNGVASAYAVSVPLSADYWCIDSTGEKGMVASALTTSPLQTACP